MSNDTERLFVQLEARVSEFEKKMRQAERSGTRTYNQLQSRSRKATQRMESDMVRSTTRVNAALASTATAVGTVSRAWGALTPLLAAAGFAATSRGVRQVVSDLSSLGKQARDVSLNVEELQAVQRGFARSARVSQDEVTASLERFNRRIGEAVNNGGPLNATIQRYGINLRRANGELREQGELLREVANAIRRAGTDQERAAIAQAAFGDTGRRLAQTLAGGADAINQMVREAENAGQVIREDLITQAEILDDRFDDVARTIRKASQELTMGGFERLLPLLDRLESLADRRSTLADIFGTNQNARGILGGELFDQLNDNQDAIQTFLDQLQNLTGAMVGVQRQGEDTVDSLRAFSTELSNAGNTDQARWIHDLADDLREAIRQFVEGEKTADEFAKTMQNLGLDVEEVVEGLGDVDASTLNAIKAQFGGLISLVELLSTRVRELKMEASGTPGESALSVRNRAIDDSGRARDAARAQLQAFIAKQERQRSLTVEQIEIEREMDRIRRDAGREGVAITEAQIEAQARLNLARRDELRGGAGGSARSGGGRSGPDEFERAVQAIQDRTAALEAEAAALVIAAQSGRAYGDAVQWAAQRARLLNAAKQSGLKITPELEKAVDRLADSYMRAASEAANMAEQLSKVEEDARNGAQAMTNLFQGIMQGSDQAKRALSNLLLQIAQVQIQKALVGLFPGAMAGLGGLMGFDRGGYTGNGDRLEPAGIVHKGEYVFSKPAVESIGVDRLETLHRQAKGYSAGGHVTDAPSTPVQPMSGVAAPGAANVKVVNVIDPGDIVAAGLSTTVGERAFFNFISNNSRAISGALS